MANGKVALYYKDYFLAIQYFNQVIKVKPYLAEPYMFRAFAKLYLEEFVGAEFDCTKSIELNPFVADAYSCRGYARLNEGKLDEAIVDFDKALELSPEDRSSMTAKAYAKVELKEFQSALEDYDKIVKKFPKDKISLYERGCLHLQMQDTISAMNDFCGVIKLDPFTSLGWSARGRVYLEQGEYEKSVADLNEAISLENRPLDYINRALVRHKLNDYKGAMADFDKALELNANEYVAYFNRGILRAEVGDNNRAIEDFEMVLKFNENEYAAIYNLAMLKAEVGDYNASIKLYSKIIERYPWFILAYYARAEAKRKIGQKQSAEKDEMTAWHIDKHRDEYLKDTARVEENVDFKKVVVVDAEKEQHKVQYKDNTLRGAIQNQNVDIELAENFVLSFYASEKSNYYSQELVDYNKRIKIDNPLKLSNKDMQLSNELIVMHLSFINELSKLIEEEPNNADAYFLRAINYSLIQDFENAIIDYNKAIYYRPNFMLAYFGRANIRSRMLNFINNEESENASDSQNKLTSEFIVRDYDQAIKISPNFAYSYVNRANFLVGSNNLKEAIADYSKAIEIEPELAEAYYNRGLVYILSGEKEKGLKDLGKAGELGIYTAYNIIKRYF